MIKFTMGSCDNKKTHRRKPKRTIKNFSFPVSLGHQISVAGGTNAVSNVFSQAHGLLANSSISSSGSSCLRNGLTLTTTGSIVPPLPETLQAKFIQPNQKVMHAAQEVIDVPDVMVECVSQNVCLLCHGQHKGDLNRTSDQMDKAGKDSTGFSLTLSQLQHWICADCQQTVTHEQEKRASHGLFDKCSVAVTSSQEIETSCSCYSCKERRRIEEEQVQETLELHQSWTELQQLLQLIYEQAISHKVENSSPGDQISAHSGVSIDTNRARELVERLCAFDPHDLFQRVISSGQDYMIDCKARLASTCPSPGMDGVMSTLSDNEKTSNSSIECVGRFVAALLDEYDALNRVCQNLSDVMDHLVKVHLCRFKLTIQMTFKQLFYSFIYADLQPHLSDIARQLRELTSLKDVSDPESSSDKFFLHRYLKFDDEMTIVSTEWRESYQLIEQYSDEQIALTTKNKFYEDIYSPPQRQAVEQYLLKNSKHGCCQCDECNVMRMVASGLISPDLTGGIDGHQSGDGSVLGYSQHRSASSDAPAVSFIDRSQFGLKGSGDGVTGHLFVPYLPAFEFPTGGEIPEEFDDDCSYQEQCSERCSPSEQSGSPEWKEQRHVEGQDSYNCVYGETNVMTSSSVDSGTRCDGSDDIDNDDADDEQDDSDDSCDDSKFVTWMQQPSGSVQNHSLQTSQRSSVVQAQQCQCHSCCQQQQQQPLTLNGLGMIRQSVTTPLYVHPQTLNILASQQQQHLQQNGAGVQSCPAALPAATVLGVLQPTLTGFDSSQSLLLPQLYQLQCPAPITVQPQHCMRTDRAGSMSGIMTPAANLGTDIGTLGWQDVYGAGDTFARGAQNANAWAPVGRPSPASLQHNAVSVTTIPLAQTTSLWRMPSPNVGHCPTATAVFSAPSPSLVRAAHCTAAGNSNQPVIYSFQPPQQALVNPPLEVARPSVIGVPFFGVPLSSVSDLTSATSMGSRSISGAGCNGTLNSISKMSSLATVGKCLASPVMSSSSTDMVSASQSTSVTPHNRPHSCQVHSALDNQEKPNGSSVGSLPSSHCVGMSNGTGSCHHHHREHVDDENDCDDDCDDDDDDDDDDCTSDESSAASGPKDGKYCECWHCEFFGHSAPPTVPTSKNYPEMRDRLRLRLKKKNEQKCGHQVDQSAELEAVQPEEKIEVPPACVATELPPVDHSTMAIDDLVKFINGSEALDKDVKSSRKAAKRARQKMRKAAGKAPVALPDERKCPLSKGRLDNDETSEKIVVVDDIRPEMSSSVKQLQQIRTSSSSEGSKLRKDKIVVVSNGNLDSSCGEHNRKLTANVKRVNSPKNSSSDDSKAVFASVNHSTKDTLENTMSTDKMVKGTRPSRSSMGKSSKLVSDSQISEVDKGPKRPNSSFVPMSSANSQGTFAKPDSNDAQPGNRYAKCKTASSGGDVLPCVITEAPSVKSTSASNGNKQQSSSTAKSVYYAKPSALLPSTAECQSTVVRSAVDAREVTAVQSKPSVAMANGDAVSNGKMAAGLSKKTAEVKPSDSKSESIVAGRTAGATKGTSCNSVSGTGSPKPKASVANGFGVHTKVATSLCNGSVEPTRVVRDIPNNTVTHAKPGAGNADVVGTNTATVVSHSNRNGLCKPLPPNMLLKPDTCTSSGLLASSVASSSHSDHHNGRIDSNSRQQLVPSVPVLPQPSETPQQDSVKGGMQVHNGVRTSPDVREASGNKTRRNRRKAKSKDGMTAVDEIFLPKDHVEPGRLDEFEREIEEFKRFCFNSTPADNREKLQINMNLKDIFVKKK